MRKVCRFLSQAILCAVLVAGCMPTGNSTDGVIGAGEYTHKSTFGPLTVYGSNDAKYLYLAMEADTTGWLSIGLDYDNGMAGANYLIGATVNGKAVVQDSFGNSQGARIMLRIIP